jgi:glutaconate CoA-transferase subunit B
MLAVAVAQRTHAPRARYINCIGAVNPRLERAWEASVEPELLHLCDEHIDLPAIFDLAREGGVDAMFFGAAQVDAGANINLERIDAAPSPQVFLPGPAGSPSMRSWVRRVLIGVPRQSRRNLVPRVDVITSAPSSRNRETVLVTDLAVWRLRDGAFVPTGVAPGVDAQRLSSATGFAFAGEPPGPTPPPTRLELAALQRIDGDGLRYRLLAGSSSPRNSVHTDEKVHHER